MSYEKQTWVNGTTHVDAEHMNHIEDGIEEVDTRLSQKITDKQDKLTAGTAIDIDENNTISVDQSQLNARNIPAEGIGYKFAEGNPCVIYDGIAEDADDITVDISPIQDLHGYDHPWVGGAGKNLLPMTVDSIKSANTLVTWSGNSYTINGVTFTIQTDDVGDVTGIIVNGTSTDRILYFYVATNFEITAESKFNVGNVYTWSSDGIVMEISVNETIYENSLDGVVVPIGTGKVQLAVTSGITINNVLFKPMLRLASETDATFEPYSNICPITGRTQVDVTRTGHNQWDEETKEGYYDAASGVYIYAAGQLCSKNFIYVTPNTAYIFQKAHNLGDIVFYDSNQMFLSGILNAPSNCVFTTPEKCYYIQINLGSTYGAEYLNNVGINYPATFTDYEPYQGQSVTVQLGQTVYGGTLNVSTGVLTITKGYILLNGSDGSTYSINGHSDKTTRAYVSISGKAYGRANMVSDKFYISALVNDAIGLMSGRNSTDGIEFFLDRSVPDTTAGVIAWFADNPAQLVYELATPQTIQLTPQQLALLESYNILTTDGDKVTLKYLGSDASNVQRVLDNTFKAFAPIEQGIATANHVVGDYISFQTQFCKVTQAIAVGEIVQIGRNVKITTVAEELMAILAQINA